jgi:hypothetical protein
LATAAITAERISDTVGMIIDVIPETLACIADPYAGTLVSVFFVSPPEAPRSCSHDMYRAPCRGKLHELRLSDRGEWSEVLDRSTWPLQRSGEKRSQHELGRLSPALAKPLLVSRLQPSDWQLERRATTATRSSAAAVSVSDSAIGAISVVYTTRNAALHEMIISADSDPATADENATAAEAAASGHGKGGPRGLHVNIRREITAPHSHPELFHKDGASGGTTAAARAAGSASLFAMRSSDGRLLSF